MLKKDLDLVIATHNIAKINEYKSLFYNTPVIVKTAIELGISEPEENGKTFEIAPYYLADLSLNKTFFNEKLDIQLGCKNVMDVKQIQSSATTGAVHGGGSGNMNISAGRNFFVQCRLTL